MKLGNSKNHKAKEIKLKTKKITKKIMWDVRYKYKGNVDYEDYLYLTAFCKSCEINEPSVMEVHHIDRNRKNNKLSNLIGLCPTCHKLVHKGIIDVFNQDGMTFIDKVRKNGIFQKIKNNPPPNPPPPTSDGTFKTKEKVSDKKVIDYIDKITTPIFNRVLQGEPFNSMTTTKNTQCYFFRPNNYRRQIEVKKKDNSTSMCIRGTMGIFPMELNINAHTKLISIKNYEKNITIQYGKKTLTAIYSCPRIKGNKQVYRIERNSIDEINQRINEIKKDIKIRLDNALKKFSRKFGIAIPFKKAIWARHEDFIKGEEFIDDIPRETIIHDTVFKKVYGKGIEFIGGKEEEPTAHYKNYIKNRAIEDIAPSIAKAITDIYDKFTPVLTGLMTNLQQMTNINIEVTKLRRDVTKIQKKKKTKVNDKDLRKYL